MTTKSTQTTQNTRIPQTNANAGRTQRAQAPPSAGQVQHRCTADAAQINKGLGRACTRLLTPSETTLSSTRQQEIPGDSPTWEFIHESSASPLRTAKRARLQSIRILGQQPNRKRGRSKSHQTPSAGSNEIAAGFDPAWLGPGVHRQKSDLQCELSRDGCCLCPPRPAGAFIAFCGIENV